MLDIIFISYDEPNADKNFSLLTDRFPHARRVHGVKGIANAHILASKKALTQFFYVVDGDAVIKDSFNFSFVPSKGDEDFVHIWYAENPIGIAYGYGGVKLFSKKFFSNVKNQVDFSTTLTKDVKIHTEISCITHFNSDEIRAYRGAFREAAKLNDVLHGEHSEKMIAEAGERLSKWLNPDACAFRESVIAGAKKGIELDSENLSFINEHDKIKQ